MAYSTLYLVTQNTEQKAEMQTQFGYQVIKMFKSKADGNTC